MRRAQRMSHELFFLLGSERQQPTLSGNSPWSEAVVQQAVDKLSSSPIRAGIRPAHRLAGMGDKALTLSRAGWCFSGTIPV
jgi:hypothetical protein